MGKRGEPAVVRRSQRINGNEFGRLQNAIARLFPSFTLGFIGSITPTNTIWQGLEFSCNRQF
jgi:hypothetical protein